MRLWTLAAVAPLAACASTSGSLPTPAGGHPERDPALNAVAWIQTAAEYEAAAEQAYAAAEHALARSLADASWTAALEQPPGHAPLPPAVILDVDETVLDNSPYVVRRILDGESFREESWGRWVREAVADAVPGALDRARAAAHAGAIVFYVTNRDAPLEEATRRNLE
ncbi:MAG: HAD family acid phosphatase, partial [Gemmatimonadota bacterium]